MTIEQRHDGKKGYFHAMTGKRVTGKLVFTWAGESRIIIEHTEVYPEFKGQHIGKQLVMEVVYFAREQNIKIIPLCPFAKAMFDKTEAIMDVLF